MSRRRVGLRAAAAALGVAALLPLAAAPSWAGPGRGHGRPAVAGAADRGAAHGSADGWAPAQLSADRQRHDGRAHGHGPATRAASAHRRGAGTTSTSTGPTLLVLYDDAGPYGALGELYAIATANLGSHFGTVRTEPVERYAAGQLDTVTAAVYIGSTYYGGSTPDAIPAAFYADVASTATPVVWMNDNIWALADAMGVPAFEAAYGWDPTTSWFAPGGSVGDLRSVEYKGRTLTRSVPAAADGGILHPHITDPSLVTVLATAVDATTGDTTPWAIRSGNLTYIGEIPYQYATETDRLLVWEDLLFDALAPGTAERHRAMVRLEDINPTSDPAQLEAIADYLYAQHVPFGFGVIPVYTDPTGYYNGGTPETYRLADRPELVKAIRYLLAHGGVLVDHGYTHQYAATANPYTAVTGDDYEFFRVTENADHTLQYAGPLPEDSTSWAAGRISSALKEFQRVKLSPQIFEFPHYAASAADYAAVNQYFTTRWERGLYFDGALSGAAPDYGHMIGQFFPYVVRDVYGATVLPEDCGDISPEPWYSYPARLPADIVDCAARNLVVRDGFASFFFHPYLDIQYLKDTVSGIQQLGYTFVAPGPDLR